MAKAVVFDVDGTLLDTADWILEAYLYVGESRGTPISRPLMLHELSLGNTLKDTYANLFPGQDFAALREKHREFQDAHMDLVKPFAGVPETLQTIRENGIKLVTMTNRVRESSIKTMTQSGILEYFDGLCCADDVLRTKPDPEHVFAALRPFEIAPKDAFVVGDSPADIESGKSAGARTIAVSHGLHADVESLKPDHVIHKIEDILPIVLP
ncbi:HAD family hydrolase [Candidatus Kaiserbacteria bacterium]|nr:HAD family hydrolase [Candidatus Kaiserbacteria bacterium]